MEELWYLSLVTLHKAFLVFKSAQIFVLEVYLYHSKIEMLHLSQKHAMVWFFWGKCTDRINGLHQSLTPSPSLAICNAYIHWNSVSSLVVKRSPFKKVQYVDNLYICAVTNRPKLPKKIVSLHSSIIRHDPTMAQATWSLAVF